MKGLLIKDFYTIKKGIKLSAFISVCVFIFMFLCKLSGEYGNLKGSVDRDILSYFVTLLGGLLSIIFTTFVADVMGKDIKSGMNKTVLSTPLSYKVLVSSRYVLLVLMSVIGVAVSVIFQVLCHFTNIKDFSLKTVGIVLLVQFICIAVASVSICVTQITGNTNYGMYASMGIVMIVLVLLVAIIKSKNKNSNQPLEVVILNGIKEHKTVSIFIIIAASIVITAVSYLISVNVRRDER